MHVCRDGRRHWLLGLLAHHIDVINACHDLRLKIQLCHEAQGPHKHTGKEKVLQSVTMLTER
jgi:hypothetical protein